MAKVYVLQAQGMGDDEDAFENIGVFSSEQKLKEATLDFLEKIRLDRDGSDDIVINVEEFELDVCTYG